MKTKHERLTYEYQLMLAQYEKFKNFYNQQTVDMIDLKTKIEEDKRIVQAL